METRNKPGEASTVRAFTLMGLLIRMRAARVRLITDADGLQVDAPAGFLTPLLRDAIRQHKAVLEDLPRPSIRAGKELILPAYAPPQYHWQPIADTLQELNAPPEVWQQFRRKEERRI